MPFAEQRKQGRPLQCWIAFELFYHPLPILLKGIGTRLPVMRALELRRKLPRLFILAGGALAHPCTCSSFPLRGTFPSFLHQELDLGILFHMTLTSLLLISA